MYNNNRNINDKYVCYCRKKSLEKRRENKMTASHWYGKTKYPNDYTTDKEYRDFLERNGQRSLLIKIIYKMLILLSQPQMICQH